MITLRHITNATADFCGVSVHAMRSKCSTCKVSHARGLAGAVARKLTDKTWGEIAKYLGSNITTVINASGKVKTTEVKRAIQHLNICRADTTYAPTTMHKVHGTRDPRWPYANARASDT